MAKKYIDIYDQLVSNSQRNGECLETTYKVKSIRKHPQVTFKGKLIGVHRASWEYHKGKIPKGMFICHHCDNPKCFRIDHLFLGTPFDNIKDMINKKRDNNFGRRKYSQSQWEKVKKLREEGYSAFQIAKKLAMRQEAISAWVIRHKIVKGPKQPKDLKFPKNIINSVLDLRKKGWKDIDIFRDLGMSESTFYRRIKEYENSSQ